MISTLEGRVHTVKVFDEERPLEAGTSEYEECHQIALVWSKKFSSIMRRNEQAD